MRSEARRFTLVGVVATLVHMFIGAALLHAGLSPGAANTVAFLGAFLFSFVGHYTYSFVARHAPFVQALIRFAMLALVAFGLNQCLLLLALHVFKFGPMLGIAMSTTCAAVFSFFAARHWAYRSSLRAEPEITSP